MKTRFLFPYWSRFLGYGFFFAGILLSIINAMHDSGSLTDDRITLTNESSFFMVTVILLVMGLFLASFSKEKIEDEQIAQLRLDSLQLAIYVNYLILIISLIFNDGNHIRDALHFNLRFPLIFYIIIFRWRIYQLNRSLKLS